MGDHFVLQVDHLLSKSTLGAAMASKNQPPLVSVQLESSLPLELVECRICQDDDLQSNLEAPCSCRGSLKYAHRKCVQRWCNEKGDTVCEICLQRFKPDYTAPQLFHCGSSPMNFRGSWEISRNDLLNPNLTASGDDADVHSRSLVYCRCVAMIFTGLLVLRQALPFLIGDGSEEDFSVADSTMLLLRVTGVILPIFVVARGLAAVHQRRRRLREPRSSLGIYTEDAEEQQQLDAAPQ